MRWPAVLTVDKQRRGATRNAASNYHLGGADLANKIEREVERRQSESDTVTKSDDEVRAEVTKEFAAHQGATMPVFLKMENPFIIGGRKETVLDGDLSDETGPLFDFLLALKDEANTHGGDGDQVMIDLYEKAMDGAKASQLFLDAKHSEGLMYAEDDNGNLISTELIRRAVEAAGFDGIIDHTVNEKFGAGKKIGTKMNGMGPGTTHYVVSNRRRSSLRSGTTEV